MMSVCCFPTVHWSCLDEATVLIVDGGGRGSEFTWDFLALMDKVHLDPRQPSGILSVCTKCLNKNSFHFYFLAV